MKIRLTITLAVLFTGLAVSYQYLWQAITPVPAVRTAIKQPAPTPSRCSEKISLSLLLMEEDKVIWRKTNDETLAIPASTSIIQSGRHKGEQGLPLAALIIHEGGIRILEVVPCSGEPLRFRLQELGRHSQRYVLAKSQKGFFKLMDLKEIDGKPVSRMPLLKNIHAVRLLP